MSAFLAGVTNILVCSGDVNQLLPSLPRRCLREIFVNFPEPPACHEGENDSKSDLLSCEFIAELPPKLTQGGSLQILTDNGNYASTILMRMRDVTKNANCRTYKSEGGSYFDRMFQRGGKSMRYELVITS